MSPITRRQLLLGTAATAAGAAASRAVALPGAKPTPTGVHVAIAGGEGFVGPTPEEAWRLAEAAHPHDRGVVGASFKAVGSGGANGDPRKLDAADGAAGPPDDRDLRPTG